MPSRELPLQCKNKHKEHEREGEAPAEPKKPREVNQTKRRQHNQRRAAGVSRRLVRTTGLLKNRELTLPEEHSTKLLSGFSPG